jgi:hypothetical protein
VPIHVDGAFDMAGDEKWLARGDLSLDANRLADARGHVHQRSMNSWTEGMFPVLIGSTPSCIHNGVFESSTVARRSAGEVLTPMP